MEWASTHVIFVLSFTALISAQDYDGSNKGYTEMPSDVPLDVVILGLYGNEIASFPDDAFVGFYQLQQLNLGGNPLTDLPNLLPVAATLKTIRLPGSGLSRVNESILRELHALDHFRAGNTPLAAWPNVPGVPHLRVLQLPYCRLPAFPALTHYPALEKLDLRGNPMTTARDGDVGTLRQLQTLILKLVPLRVMPYHPQALHTLTLIDVASSYVTTLPLTCPAQNLTVKGVGSGISLCRCENAWLAAVHAHRGGSVALDSMTCGDAATAGEIVRQQCQRTHGQDRAMTVVRKHTGFLCQFPVHSIASNVTKIDCALLCWEVAGCLSFGLHLPPDGERGECVILAANDSPLPLSLLPHVNSTLWDYYTLTA